MKSQILNSTPKEEQKAVIKKLKEEQHRKLTLLGEQVCIHRNRLAIDRIDIFHILNVSFAISVRTNHCRYATKTKPTIG